MLIMTIVAVAMMVAVTAESEQAKAVYDNSHGVRNDSFKRRTNCSIAKF